MASTKASRNKVRWTYTDDGAVEYATSADAVYVLDPTDGAKYGGSAAALDVPDIPRGFRKRAVRCVGGGVARWIPAYTVASDLWTTPGTTLSRDLLGTDTAFTSTAKRRGERHSGRATIGSS